MLVRSSDRHAGKATCAALLVRRSDQHVLTSMLVSRSDQHTKAVPLEPTLTVRYALAVSGRSSYNPYSCKRKVTGRLKPALRPWGASA
eukprot:6314105-Prymnesium_polylepis.1